SGLLQALGFLLGDLAGGGVDDRGASIGARSADALAQERVGVVPTLARRAGLERAQAQVGASEAPDDLRGLGAEVELGEDLVADHGGRRSRARQDLGLARQAPGELADLHVLGAKV